MAAVKEKPDTLHSILDRFVVAQRKDIKEFSGGHLNESKMLQQRHDAKHKPWRSANVNKSISVPAQLSGKQKCGERNVTMTDTIMNFSLGTTGNIPQPQNLKVSPGPRSKRPLNVSRASTEDSDCSYTKHDDGVLVEEIKPLGLQKSPRKLGNAADIKESDEDLLCRDRSIVRLKYDFLPSHMDAVTKADRFVKMREYENDILKKHDTTEQNVLSGTKAVIHLESKLKKDLDNLQYVGYGPNFHRLQIYSGTFDDLIKDSTTFGYILNTIKMEYDDFVATLLDGQSAKHQVLYEQVEQLSARGTSNPRLLKRETERVKTLQQKAKEQLEENQRLRRELAAEEMAIEPSPKPALRSTLYSQQPSPEITDQIEQLHRDILEKLDATNALRSELRQRFVPSTVCNHLEQCIKDTEVEIQKLTSQKEYFERSIMEMETKLKDSIEEADTTEKDAKRVWKRITAVKSLGRKHTHGMRNIFSDSDEETEEERKWSWYIS